MLLLLLSGLVMASLGVVGLYVGKTFEQVKERPLYVIDETVGAPGPPGDRPAGGEQADPLHAGRSA